MIEETAKFIQSNYPNSKKVGLLSTDGTLKAKIYDLYFNRQNIQVINLEKEMQNSIMEIIYGIKAGKKEIQIDAIYNAIEELKAGGAEVFILGCTELSVVNETFKLEKNLTNAENAVYIVDAVNVIVEKAIEFAGRKVLE
ncbi:MAG TPA: aspartate/glutamate racemase family protein, partial [Clostridia bacterium]|nr:aspartate/glutamate racemase family protein [Clostridia bacterium]